MNRWELVETPDFDIKRFKLLQSFTQMIRQIKKNKENEILENKEIPGFIERLGNMRYGCEYEFTPPKYSCLFCGGNLQVIDQSEEMPLAMINSVGMPVNGYYGLFHTKRMRLICTNCNVIVEARNLYG